MRIKKIAVSNFIIMLLLGFALIFVSSCTDNKVEIGVEDDNNDNLEEKKEEKEEEVDVTAGIGPDIEDSNGYRDSWLGKYNEYIYSYDFNSITFSKDSYGDKENIPYIELLEDGRYDFNLNWYTGMAISSGTWDIDEHNKNIVHLSKGEWIEKELILERAFDGAIILRGVDWLAYDDILSTSIYGGILLRDDIDQDDVRKKDIDEYPNYWANLYYHTIEYILKGFQDEELVEIQNKVGEIKSIILYDTDKDGIPELILEDELSGEYHVINIRSGKPNMDVLDDSHVLADVEAFDVSSGNPTIIDFIDYMDNYIIGSGD